MRYEIRFVIWILIYNGKNFEKAFGVSKTEIPNYLNKVVSNGFVISNELKNINGRNGFERIYYFEKNIMF